MVLQKKVPILSNPDKAKKVAFFWCFRTNSMNGTFSQPQGYPWGFESFFAEVGRRAGLVPAPEQNANAAINLGRIGHNPGCVQSDQD